MATKEKKGGKGGKKGGEAKARGPHAGAALPVPPPRLKDFYNRTVRQKLRQQFGFKNPHQIPQLEKIVVNVGVGEAIKQPKALDAVVEEVAIITGQTPVRQRGE